jgi:hypothetical protein
MTPTPLEDIRLVSARGHRHTRSALQNKRQRHTLNTVHLPAGAANFLPHRELAELHEQHSMTSAAELHETNPTSKQHIAVVCDTT